ncbi:MAG TPA: hypothetical protein VGI23_07225 [Steroidobacteraceae bacterium]
MCLDEAARYSESEACTACAAIPRVFQAHEGFEDLLALVGWDAGALVVDQQGDEFGVCRD